MDVKKVVRKDTIKNEMEKNTIQKISEVST